MQRKTFGKTKHKQTNTHKKEFGTKVKFKERERKKTGESIQIRSIKEKKKIKKTPAGTEQELVQ